VSADSETRLAQAITRHASLAIAVSGGVDSMSLMGFAHRLGAISVKAIHAVSPAVPPAATQRVKARAEAEGWDLVVTGAGEFDDPRYRDNPVDRCYFCKSNLYTRIRSLTAETIASGANRDDLGDYRPGLLAASERGVVHPFIEADMVKADIRVLARRIGFDEVAELPAQPCLSSRVETGIAIDAGDLAFVDKVETALAPYLPQGIDLRCRITHGGVAIEVGATDFDDAALAALAERLCAAEGRRFAGLRAYRRGAMFVRG
jgi:uncharacterized protein